MIFVAAFRVLEPMPMIFLVNQNCGQPKLLTTRFFLKVMRGEDQSL